MADLHQHNSCRLSILMKELLSIHLSECHLHEMKSLTTTLCPACQAFVCKVCGATEKFTRHFLDVPDQATTPELDAWVCEVMTQGDAFAAVHHHGRVN